MKHMPEQRGTWKEQQIRKKRTYDKHAKEAPLIIGERVYTRNRPLGRNKIQDAWDSTVYRVIQKQGNNNVYVVEPADGLGRQRTINRVDLRKCVHGNQMVDEISTYDKHKRHGLSRDKRHSSNNAATSSSMVTNQNRLSPYLGFLLYFHKSQSYTFCNYT